MFQCSYHPHKPHWIGKPSPATTDLCTNNGRKSGKLHCSSAAKAKEKIPNLQEENPLPHEHLIDFVNTEYCSKQVVFLILHLTPFGIESPFLKILNYALCKLVF